jgi:hypothetical protein
MAIDKEFYFLIRRCIVYKRLIYLTVVLVLIFVSGASALTETKWTDASWANSLWSKQTNWSAGVPGTDNDVWLKTIDLIGANGPTIDSSTAAVVGGWVLGPGYYGDMTLNIAGGSLTVNGQCLAIGQYKGTGIVNVTDGGSINITSTSSAAEWGSLYVGNMGNGTLNVSGGSTINVSQALRVSYQAESYFGRINLGLGTIDCNDLMGYSEGTNEIRIDITKGTLIVRNKSGAPIQQWIDLEYIIAYGGSGTVIHTVNGNGYDVLTAVMGETSIVDDFDSYADSADLRNTWVENVAGVVYLEETIANDGNSMKIVYDGASPYRYEGVRTYGTAQDWTAQNIEVLDVWFRGKSTNDAEQMYVTLSDDTNSATVVYDDPNAVKSETWQPWHIDLQDFTDVNLAGVEQISIGIGDGSSPAGSGEVYFDDVALFQPRCLDKPAIDEGNLNSDCAIDFKDIVILAGNWLKEGMWP